MKITMIACLFGFASVLGCIGSPDSPPGPVCEDGSVARVLVKDPLPSDVPIDCGGMAFCRREYFGCDGSYLGTDTGCEPCCAGVSYYDPAIMGQGAAESPDGGAACP